MRTCSSKQLIPFLAFTFLMSSTLRKVPHNLHRLLRLPLLALHDRNRTDQQHIDQRIAAARDKDLDAPALAAQPQTVITILAQHPPPPVPLAQFPLVAHPARLPPQRAQHRVREVFARGHGRPIRRHLDVATAGQVERDAAAEAGEGRAANRVARLARGPEARDLQVRFAVLGELHVVRGLRGARLRVEQRDGRFGGREQGVGLRAGEDQARRGQDLELSVGWHGW